MPPTESNGCPLTGGPVPCHAMPDRFGDRSPDHPSEDDLRAHAAFEARRSASGIGAAVARSGYRDGEHFWECIVSDGEEWHFIRVLAVDLGSSPDLATEDIERGIERFAATLPERYRLGALLNATPLHVDRRATVSG
jgi:hypothetical protein